MSRNHPQRIRDQISDCENLIADLEGSIAEIKRTIERRNLELELVEYCNFCACDDLEHLLDGSGVCPSCKSTYSTDSGFVEWTRSASATDPRLCAIPARDVRVGDKIQTVASPGIYWFNRVQGVRVSENDKSELIIDLEGSTFLVRKKHSVLVVVERVAT